MKTEYLNRFNAINEANQLIGQFHIVATNPPKLVKFGGKIYQFDDKLNAYAPHDVPSVVMLWVNETTNVTII